MALSLRPYQREAVAAVYKYLAEHDDNPCVVTPTASGKSVMIAQIATDAVKLWSGRVLVLAHVKELLEQNAGKIRALCDGIDVGVYSAGLHSRDTGAPVIVAGIQSVYNKSEILGKFDLIIVDEAHLIQPDGEGMYRTFLSAMKEINPLLRVIGFTATPFRMKGGLICKPENILNKICYEVGIKEMIAQGYLSPLISRAGSANADLSKLHVRGGEFIADEVEKAMDSERLTLFACGEIIELTKDRKSVLIFASSVKHCRHIAETIKEKSGMECAIVTGDTPADERAEIIARFRGEAVTDMFGESKPPLKFLCNVNVLTTGFDAPNTDCIVLLRPTNSAGLLIQMVGRGFRLSPETGKTNCIAEGTLILTNVGLVPIEKITKNMLLWDGIEFVRHDGAIYKGEQNVITYAGLTATPDHKVYYKHHWRTFQASAENNLQIAVTEHGGKAIREVDGYFRRGDCPCGKRHKKKKNTCFNALSVWRGCLEKFRQSQKGNFWVSSLRQTENGSEMACSSVCSCKKQMRKSAQFSLQGLRCAWDSILFFRSDRNGSLFNGSFRLLKSKDANRPDQQQRELCSWKYSPDYSEYKCYEYQASEQNKNASIQNETSRNTICRCDFVSSFVERIFGRGNCKTVLPEIQQTKRRVWDILNAGPRHRFTANGLLVSNCMVLDYGENILRHGPIDCIRVHDKTPGHGDAPAKKCPECYALIHAAYSKCPECGFEFPPSEHSKLTANSSGEAILSGQVTFDDYEVMDVTYEVHAKRGQPDAPKTLMVSYMIGFHQFKYEFVCPEHSGYARDKFVRWWKERAADGVPVPDTAKDAAEWAWMGALAEPTSIRVRSVSGEKYDRVVSWKLGPKPQGIAPKEDIGTYDDCPF